MSFTNLILLYSTMDPDDWLKQTKEYRYDFYMGFLAYLRASIGSNTRDEFMKEIMEMYPNIKMIPQPTDISYRKCKYIDREAVPNNYARLVYGELLGTVILRPQHGEKVAKWFLKSSYAMKRNLGKFVKVNDGWIYPLPGLNGKQTVSLLEIREQVTIWACGVTIMYVVD